MITTINGNFGDFRVLAEHLVQWFAFEIAFSHNVAIVGIRCRRYLSVPSRSKLPRARVQQIRHLQKEQNNAIVVSLVREINRLGDTPLPDRWGRAPNIRVR